MQNQHQFGNASCEEVATATNVLLASWSQLPYLDSYEYLKCRED
jgi:hypothetical protein